MNQGIATRAGATMVGTRFQGDISYRTLHIMPSCLRVAQGHDFGMGESCGLGMTLA
jgi:hypothetical protein